MRVILSKRAFKDYGDLSENLKKTADKQFNFLLKNLNHSSLRAKKYDESRDIWQGRISGNWRFYFQIHGDVYEIVTIIKHPK
ncbi:MAG: hypothetical protein Q7R89_03880 [bacterium]|nr:hypothetical protein [bacterium]